MVACVKSEQSAAATVKRANMVVRVWANILEMLEEKNTVLGSPNYVPSIETIESSFTYNLVVFVRHC